MRTGLPLPFGAATAPRTFIYIDNLAAAVVRCVEHERAANETTSTDDFVHRIASALGWRVWTPRVKPVLLDAACRLAGRGTDFHRLFDQLELDTSRIRTLLDWSPPVSMDEGLRRVVAKLRK
jgi:nucleoside-diphosphate-sugar epimerase